MKTDKMTYRVYPAEPYRSGQLGSFGKASCMLLRQFNFPDSFSKMDTHVQADHDRCFTWDYDHTKRCFLEHTSKSEVCFEEWVNEAKEEQIFAFLSDILKQEKGIKWTGFRIMGSVNVGNGYPVWTLELFAKNSESDTNVYTGAHAPNVLSRPRYS